MMEKWCLVCFILIPWFSVSWASNCHTVPDVQNSKWTVQSDADGTKVTYACVKGRLFGNHVLTCNVSQLWDVPPPVCREACSVPNKIQNAQLAYPHYKLETFPVQSKVRYECVPGFKQQSGETFATCRVDLLWENASLVCVPMACPKPDVHNAEITSGLKIQYVAGDTVTVQCSQGFLLEGNRRSTCNRAATWAPELPKCVKKDFTHCGIKLEDWKPFLENEKLCLEKQKADLEQNGKVVSEA